jgi:cytochrome c556
VIFATQRVNPTEIKRAPEPSGATDPLMGVFNGWEAVETAALMLSEGADLLMTPGRVCSNGRPVPQAADWATFAQQVRDASKVVLAAAKAKDLDKMLDVSDTLNTSCVNCHNRYRRNNRCQ